MRRYLTILIIFSFTIALFASSIFKESSAVPETNRVTITWSTQSEIGVKQFAVQRSNDDVYFVTLKFINPKGPGSEYKFVDENVMFKGSSALFYRIRALGDNDQVIEEISMIVHPNISGIFRTWGAIKAMFR